MKPRAVFVLGLDNFDKVYGGPVEQEVRRLVDVIAPPISGRDTAAMLAAIRDVEVIFSTWGMAKMDAAFLAAAGRLKLVLYAAGSIRPFVTDEFWSRGIAISSAYAANAVPVAEYALAAILFGLKQGWHYAIGVKQAGSTIPRRGVAGAFRSTVGIIGLGMVGRRVCELLKAFDVQVLACDPLATPEAAAEAGATLTDLDSIFHQCDAVSLHAPWIPQTEGMITGRHLSSMKHQAVFINTARGAIVRESEMIDVLRQRPDLTAVLDVTWPEPPAEGSQLYSLPNVVLTPHIAGSLDLECRRMGMYMVEELKRHLTGQPLKYGISRQAFEHMA